MGLSFFVKLGIIVQNPESCCGVAQPKARDLAGAWRDLGAQGSGSHTVKGLRDGPWPLYSQSPNLWKVVLEKPGESNWGTHSPRSRRALGSRSALAEHSHLRALTLRIEG